MRTRPLVVTDDPLLAVATLGNLNWSGERFTAEEVRAQPGFRHYCHLVPRRGDFGLVAGDDIPVGVAWALFLPAEEPGFGFLDETTPEVSLWVRADSRGQGTGRLLLRRLQQEAVRRGIPRLSLSVEDGNRARRLYASEGFVPVEGREQDGVMSWEASAWSRETGSRPRDTPAPGAPGPAAR